MIVKCVCAWCERNLDANIDGSITLHEKNPISEYIDDELYHFCGYKCLKAWMKL